MPHLQDRIKVLTSEWAGLPPTHSTGSQIPNDLLLKDLSGPVLNSARDNCNITG